ncbi:hypothetical protein OEZ86_003821 [Tetradesmus obliquus]|nr:hypothetical protein OEZ86_003821 [Tetradesmus obliquus]
MAGTARAANVANSAAAGAAALHDAARWDQACTAQRQSSSSLMAVLERVMTGHGNGLEAVCNQAAQLQQQQQQEQEEAEEQLQHHVQPAAGPAHPNLQEQQQQQQVLMQQGSWQSSSSSSAASSSAACGAALGGIMSPTGSITGLMLSPAAGSAKQQQPMRAVPATASLRCRPWQCSSTAVPGFTAAAASEACLTAGGVAGAKAFAGNGAGTAAAAVHAAPQHGSPAEQAYQAAVGAVGATAMAKRAHAAVRAAPGPSDSRVINQHRQHILRLEQQLGNMHPQVSGQAGMHQHSKS